MEQNNLQLKQLLLARKILSADTLNMAYNQAESTDQPLKDYLINNNILTSKQLLFCQAEMFGLPVIDLENFNKDNYPQNAISEKIIKKHNIFPIAKAGNKLFIAVANPLDTAALDEVRFSSDLTPVNILADNSDIKNFIIHVFEDIEELFDAEDDPALDDGLEVDSLKEDLNENTIEDISSEKDDTPVVKYVHSILLNAIRNGASDIHFEPYEKNYRVRQRTDGILEEISKPPTFMAHKIASRIKIMADLDISERMKPQDGRIRLKISKTKAIDFRVSTLPTLFGEKIVIRVLDSSAASLSIDMLGFNSKQKKLFLDSIAQPQGMVLVTGPTGSGKTVTLYTGLNILNKVERNISTVEDPVEINLQGINQVNVNNKQGLDFSQALRAFLRQDPDIIMVGEIRDKETSSVAIKASQTGHLVLSTLHTNSATETITRLLNIGISSFDIATSVKLIIAQRLARRLCSACKLIHNVPENALLELGFTEKQTNKAKIYQPSGCRKCNKGYKGRVGIYEVVQITPDIQNIIMNGGDSIQISKQAQKESFLSIRQSGIQAVLDGVTSIEEINRVTLSQ